MVSPSIATEIAEVVARRGVGGRQLGHLGVRGAAVGRAEDVGRARAGAAVVVGVPDHDGVAVDRHGPAEVVVRAASAAVSLATWPYVAPPSLVRRT